MLFCPYNTYTIYVYYNIAMAKQKSTIPQELFALIPADEKGCSINYNKPRDVYYVYRWLGTTYDPKRKRGVDRRESVGAIKDGKFTFSKNYLAKKQLEALQGKCFKPTPEELEGKEHLDKTLESVDDPRVAGKVVYPLEAILLVSVLSALAGGTSAVSIALYWKRNRLQLQELIEGFPSADISHDTINRVFRLIEKDQVEALVEKLTRPLVNKMIGRLIHADGQAVRASRSPDKCTDRAFFNVYDSSNNLLICHRQIETKENEIPVSQEILQTLDIEDAVITVDALNTQKKFAKICLEGKANYCFAIKENHRKLYDTLRAIFNEETVRKRCQDTDCAHGRIENRTVEVMSAKLLGRGLRRQWPGLETGSIIAATTQSEDKRNAKTRKKPTRQETRYFISSISPDKPDIAATFARIIRSHWSIENNLHWTLDTSFMQDRIQTKNETYLSARVTLNKIAFNLLNQKKAQLQKSESHRYSMDSLKQLCQNPADALETLHTILGRAKLK